VARQYVPSRGPSPAQSVCKVVKLQGQGRVSADAQALDLRERVHDFFGDPVAEVFVLGTVAHFVKQQPLGAPGRRGSMGAGSVRRRPAQVSASVDGERCCDARQRYRNDVLPSGVEGVFEPIEQVGNSSCGISKRVQVDVGGAYLPPLRRPYSLFGDRSCGLDSRLMVKFLRAELVARPSGEVEVSVAYLSGLPGHRSLSVRKRNDV